MSKKKDESKKEVKTHAAAGEDYKRSRNNDHKYFRKLNEQERSMKLLSSH
jgi:hypothetical protein